MSMVWRIDVTEINSAALANQRPGQMRRPNPKEMVEGSLTLGFILRPSFVRYLSGMNLSGSGKSSGLRNIALEGS